MVWDCSLQGRGRRRGADPDRCLSRQIPRRCPKPGQKFCKFPVDSHQTFPSYPLGSQTGRSRPYSLGMGWNVVSKRTLLISLMILITAAALAAPGSAAPVLANTGTITALNGSGAQNPGDPISISSSGRADSQIQVSNLYYEVFAAGGARVASHQTNLSPFDPGDTFSDSFSTSNTPTTGTYTVTICWSTGNAHNCDIASASTEFHSVPTLGTALTGLAALLLGGFLWRNRRLFDEGLS